MFPAVVAILAGFSMVASAAELHGTWSASTNGRALAGTWTADANKEGGVSGTWALQDPGGKILMQGGWSASKAAQSWNGAWRSVVLGSNREYSGTWTAPLSLPPDAPLTGMLESALRAVVTGTWRSGAYSGAWSIRTAP